MTFLIVDLEWNGAWSKIAHGYFNEIIEIGAVKLDDHMAEQGRFHAVIRPQVSRKLSSIVTDLTNITEEELAQGVTFREAMVELRRFAGDGERALVTWSNTDLLVLMENCRFFYDSEQVEGFTHYADLQAYCQELLAIGAAHQPGLDYICAQLGISAEGMSLHRALDDARLTAEVCRHIYRPESFASYLQPMDEEFYARVTFKITPITDPDSPLIPRSAWEFRCPTCGRSLRRMRKWQYRHRAFCADMVCRSCQKEFAARVQGRLKYEGPEIRKKLSEKVKAEDSTPTPTSDATS